MNFLTLWSMRWCRLDIKLFALCIRLLVITELVVSGTQCSFIWLHVHQLPPPPPHTQEMFWGIFSTLAREKLSFSKLTTHDLKALKFQGRERLAIYILKFSGKQLTSASCRLIDQPSVETAYHPRLILLYESFKESHGPVIKPIPLH